MATWPTAGSFPQTVMFDGFQEETPVQVIRTKMDIGPEKIRRRTTAAPRPFKAQLPLTTAQVATLDTFYLTTCVGGSLAFDWTHPRTGAAASFRFVGPITYRRHGPDLWIAAFQMEMMP